MSLAIVLAVRLFGPHPVLGPASALASNLDLERIVTVVGGLCLVPLFGLAWVGSASPVLRRLTLMMAPAWLVWLLVTDALDQGARLLGLVALLFVPLTLQGVQVALARPAARALAAPGAPR
jgi:hypothetical protein